MENRSSRVNGAKYRAATGTLIQRILTRREVSPEGCWHWPGEINPDGYGLIMVPLPGKRRLKAMVHRLVYMHVVDPDLPDDHQVDHTCHDPKVCKARRRDCLHRRCFNLDHLEGVPQEVNHQRSGSPAALNAAKEKCPAGHDYDEANTRIDPKTGGRICRKCQNAQALDRKLTLRPELRAGHACRSCGADISHLDGRMWYCDDCRTQRKQVA